MTISSCSKQTQLLRKQGALDSSLEKKHEGYSRAVQRAQDFSRKKGKYKWISILIGKIFPIEDAEFLSLIGISLNVMNQE